MVLAGPCLPDYEKISVRPETAAGNVFEDGGRRRIPAGKVLFFGRRTPERTPRGEATAWADVDRKTCRVKRLPKTQGPDGRHQIQSGASICSAGISFPPWVF